MVPAAAGSNQRIKNAHQFRIHGGLVFATREGHAAHKSRRAERLRPYMKAMRRRIGHQRAAAGGADAVTIGARDVSPQRGGLIHTSAAPQRRRHCNIAPEILLVCSLAASDGKDNAAIRCGCRDLGVGRGGLHELLFGGGGSRSGFCTYVGSGTKYCGVFPAVRLGRVLRLARDKVGVLVMAD